MNMSIASAPIAVVVTPASSQAGTANGASGRGFAGALLGAMSGTSNASAAVNAMMPLGLAGLLGGLGITQTEEQPVDLLAMLANLVEQLGQVEQVEQLPDEAGDQLAALLVAFQAILQQLRFEPTLNETPDQDASVALIDPKAVQAEQLGKTVVAALRQTLQQVTEALTYNSELLKQSPILSGELQSLVKALNDRLKSIAGASNEQPKAYNDEAPVVVNRDSKLEAAGRAASKDATNQALTVPVDNKPAAPVLRDPVWKFQIVKPGAENVSFDGLAANVAPVLSGEEAARTESQPAWTFLNNDVKAATDAAQARAAMPAQVPVQQFAEQMQKFMVKQFLLTQGNGTTEAKLTLTPEHLGQVDIRIVMQNGQLTAQFMTDNVMARELLENQMSQLRTSLHAQGLQVDRLEVVQQPSSSNTTSFLSQDQRHNGTSGNGSGSGNRNDGGTYDEANAFEDELNRTTSLRVVGYGSSLNVTA